MLFPYSPNIEVEDGLTVDYREVLKHIGPLLTESRRSKIDKLVANRSYSVGVVLENIYDRGNSSAVMRTAEAFGFARFDMIEISERFKAAGRVTAGADKWLYTKKYKSTSDCIVSLKQKGYRICVTSLEASKPLGEVDFTKPTALVLGNEKDGVSKEMLDAADERILIPMQGFVQSFNISVAGAIALYHIYQERLRHYGRIGDLNPQEQDILKSIYYLKTLDSSASILRAKLNL